MILIEALAEDDAFKAATGYFNTNNVSITATSAEQAEQFIGSSEPDIVTPEAMRIGEGNVDNGFGDISNDSGDMNELMSGETNQPQFDASRL